VLDLRRLREQLQQLVARSDDDLAFLGAILRDIVRHSRQLPSGD
jgi:hypothetical protein